MYKKIVLSLSLILLSQMTFADTCPTVTAIKKNQIDDWKIYDSEDNKPLSQEREAYFKKNVAQFSLAEITRQQKKEGVIHCYYHDVNGSDFEAYLVRASHIPSVNGKQYWYQVTGSMHCAASPEQCEFKRILPPTQLAKR